MNSAVMEGYIARHNALLRERVTQADIPASKLKDAILYSLFPGGKRLRPLLVYLCGEVVQTNSAVLDIIAIAIELIHCYSLVHDDLPCMDNDDFRRGRPTCHRAFDEATAVLAGDGMQALAIDMLLTHLPPYVSSDKINQITHELIKASGPANMVSGQSLDLTELSQPHITEEQLQHIHRLKTGSLFSTCINMTILASEPNEITSQSLRQFSDLLGVVFQMQDDYHDRYTCYTLLGKNRPSDEANHKTTFSSIFDKQSLLTLINDCYNKAQETLEPLGNQAIHLRELTRSLQQRTPIGGI